MGRGGNIPLGYFKDPEKTAETFVIARRRQALRGVGRLGPLGGRRPRHAARAGLDHHQLRRREDPPRRGRAGAQGPPRRCSTASWSACPTSAGARRVAAVVQFRDRHGRRARATWPTTPASSSPATRSPASCTSSTRSCARRAASPTTRGPRSSPGRGLMAGLDPESDGAYLVDGRRVTMPVEVRAAAPGRGDVPRASRCGAAGDRPHRACTPPANAAAWPSRRSRWSTTPTTTSAPTRSWRSRSWSTTPARRSGGDADDGKAVEHADPPPSGHRGRSRAPPAAASGVSPSGSPT